MHAALRQFELCRTVLKTELDLAPEIETTELYNQIRERRSSSSPVKAGGRQILLTEADQTSWLEQILSTPVRGCLPNQPTGSGNPIHRPGVRNRGDYRVSS